MEVHKMLVQDGGYVFEWTSPDGGKGSVTAVLPDGQVLEFSAESIQAVTLGLRAIGQLALVVYELGQQAVVDHPVRAGLPLSAEAEAGVIAAAEEAAKRAGVPQAVEVEAAAAAGALAPAQLAEHEVVAFDPERTAALTWTGAPDGIPRLARQASQLEAEGHAAIPEGYYFQRAGTVVWVVPTGASLHVDQAGHLILGAA